MSNFTQSDNLKSGLLSRREREIAALVARGLRNRQISDELYISEQTVKNHVSNIFEKTGVRRRVQLAFHSPDQGRESPTATPLD